MTTTALTDALTYTGATYRQLDHWTRLGLLHPANPHPGSGYQRTWPDSELAVARTMVALITAGLTLEAAHHAARNNGLLPGGTYRIEEVA